MGSITSDRAIDTPMFIGPVRDAVYVVLSMGDDLQNVLGTFRDAAAVWHCLCFEVPPEKLVVGIADIEALVPDNCSLIATKKHEPELRVAYCVVDSEVEEEFAS